MRDYLVNMNLSLKDLSIVYQSELIKEGLATHENEI
jgi:hypothetical protein